MMTTHSQPQWISNLDAASSLARRVVDAGQLELVPAGWAIVREGEQSRSFFIVVSGEVAVTSDELDGVELARLGAGEIFGEMAALTGQPRSATVRAVEATMVIEVDAEMLDSDRELRAFVGRLGIARTERTLEKLAAA